MLDIVLCLPHALEYGGLYMMEETSNECLSKIIFISTTSLSYNYVVMENGAMLNSIKINTNMNYFNNTNLMKLVLKA